MISDQLAKAVTPFGSFIEFPKQRKLSHARKAISPLTGLWKKCALKAPCLPIGSDWLAREDSATELGAAEGSQSQASFGTQQ